MVNNHIMENRVDKVHEFAYSLRDYLVGIKDVDARMKVRREFDLLLHRKRLTWDSLRDANNPHCNLGQWTLANERSRELFCYAVYLADKYDISTDDTLRRDNL